MAVVKTARSRAMALVDLPAVLRVERASFGSPWTPGMFEDELRQTHSWCRVAVDESDVPVAFLLARLYGDSWHVMDLAVAPTHRRRGLAGALLDEFLRHTAAGGLPVVLEVREGNGPALALYAGRGFREVGRRPRYYPDTAEAAVLLESVFGEEPS